MFTNHEATPTTRVLLTMATTAAGGQKKNTEPCHLCRRPINDSRNRRTLGSRTSECATTAIDSVCSELGRCRNDFELRSVCKPCFQDLEGLGKAEAKIALLRARFLGYLRPRASIGLSPSPAKRTASIAVTPTRPGRKPAKRTASDSPIATGGTPSARSPARKRPLLIQQRTYSSRRSLSAFLQAPSTAASLPEHPLVLLHSTTGSCPPCDQPEPESQVKI